MTPKPEHLFDRTTEWDGLTRFASRQYPGAALGVVSGRRRQGKSFLLEALTLASGGIYFPALEATEAISLRQFATVLLQNGIAVPRPFHDWGDAIAHLFTEIRDQPRTVVIDEFPFLVRSTPSLPSIIQRELGPGGSGRTSQVRLILCGSAMSVMGRLLSGQAPLRGRASMELLVRPFGYRAAATFWEVDDPTLAVLLHSVVGGTPAYRREFVAYDVPDGLADFDSWVTRTVLNPQSPLFREARYLLSEETDIRDPSLYHSVLSAVAQGNATNGGIASFVGRKSSEIAHPLNVLEDCALLAKEPDAFRAGKSTYRIIEPLVTFYQAIMWPDFARLETGQESAAIWSARRPTFDKQVVGPHFEALCREFALSLDARQLFGEPPGEVRSGVINDPASKSQIEIDVVVFGPQSTNEPRRILSLGEVKWGERMGHGHIDRLARARSLLAAKGFDVRDTVLTCYSGTGFTDELRADNRRDIALVGLDQIYRR
ncbi:ATP-binding protein [Nocardia sp. NEAU-G5]|uniref:ATP-binding protein n=1 Tax=Nocardia albiluteola TaxID=2842303 RepID=A0ABS6B7U2_9NOCA|nr:ATP-binding protein [Nocardia albiluteola]MBU3066377.1 ATP-binding protein [Nocardia albiluteola]